MDFPSIVREQKELDQLTPGNSRGTFFLPDEQIASDLCNAKAFAAFS
jgi:hypothetical protein